MKLTQEQAEKLKTLKTMEDVNAFFKAERIELSPEDLDKISGGGILDPIFDSFKYAGNWVYDNLIDPAVDAAVDVTKWFAGAAFETLGIEDHTGDSLTAPAKEK